MDRVLLDNDLPEDISQDSKAFIKILTLTSIAGAFVNQATVPIARDLEISSYDKEVLHHVKKYDLSRPRYVSERHLSLGDPKSDRNTYSNV